MRKRYFNNICCGVILLFSGLLASCSDDELNSGELKVYVNTGLQNYIEIAFSQTPVSAIGGMTAGFPVRSTRELVVDAEVRCAVEEALVESYNEANKTTYQLLPANIYELVVTKVTIKQGEQISQDSIRFELTHPSELTVGERYILPIRLAEINSSDKGLEISKNLNTVYIIISSSFTNVKTEQTPPPGSLIDKSGWKVTASSEINPYKAENIIDGNPATSWFGNRISSLTLDMGTMQTLTGLRLTPNYLFSSNYNITVLEVLTSEDNNKWTNHSALTIPVPTSGNATNPEYRYIHFYSPVAARYFRLEIIEVGAYNSSLAEIDAYK